jgi:hypothetical protein
MPGTQRIATSKTDAIGPTVAPPLSDLAADRSRVVAAVNLHLGWRGDATAYWACRCDGREARTERTAGASHFKTQQLSRHGRAANRRPLTVVPGGRLCAYRGATRRIGDPMDRWTENPTTWRTGTPLRVTIPSVHGAFHFMPLRAHPLEAPTCRAGGGRLVGARRPAATSEHVVGRDDGQREGIVGPEPPQRCPSARRDRDRRTRRGARREGRRVAAQLPSAIVPTK